MQQEINRVIEGMEEWKAKEKNIGDLFSPQATRTRYFEKLKLDQLYKLSRSIKNPTKDEKMMLRILDGEIDRLERRLYPNLLHRLLEQIIRGVSDVFRRPGLDSNDRTLWMSKPYIRTVPETQQKEKKSNLEVKYKQQVQPALLEKKRQSPKKGLRV